MKIIFRLGKKKGKGEEKVAIPHGRIKLGKKAPRLDKRTLRFSKYVKKAVIPPLPTPPSEVSWVVKPSGWPMYLNDQLGDCVIAGMGHMEEQWNFYAGHPFQPTDSDILLGYEKVGGYVPGDPSTDNGCVMLDALKYWRNTGLGGHRIVAFMSVDPTNMTEVFQAIELLGNVFIGVGLPISAQGQDKWIVPDGGPFGDGSPGSWGGHAIPVMAASPKTLTCITWGERLKMSHNFFTDYCDEAYAVLSQDWIGAGGLSPSQFNISQLQADLAQL